MSEESIPPDNGLVQELAALLRKHNARIEFDVDEGSDVYGLTGQRIVVIDRDGREAVVSPGWDMTAVDVDRGSAHEETASE